VFTPVYSVVRTLFVFGDIVNTEEIKFFAEKATVN